MNKEHTRNRFNKKYIPEPNSGCWLWTDSLDKYGYGRLQIGHAKTHKAHRISYLLFKGEVPTNLVVMHTCDTRACVNPWHLRLGTAADNNADMMAKGRYVSGGKPHPRAKNGRAKLTEKQVYEIRFWFLMGDTKSDLATRYSVHIGTVDKIVRNVLWKDE